MLAHLIGAQASLSQLPGGVVVVAGGTGSGKSTVVRGIAWHLVQSRIRQYVAESQSDFTKRMDRPHFLTVENPIEEYLIHGAASNPAIVQKKYGIDYTPRQIPHDTPTLRQALMLDALRQTPFLTYVGEMRSTEDMRTVLDFAETGHAVITTMHAGSVREAIERLLASGGARTAADKGQIARRIRAIVHLEPLIVNDPNLKEKKVVVPAIWRNTPAGVAALVADGLSSVLPSRHEIYSGSAAFSFGRASFVEALATHGDLVRAGIRHDRIQTVRAVLIQAAMERDLNVSRDCTE
jgi:Tfp pilus assembly pilus retraction ATPase PilT